MFSVIGRQSIIVPFIVSEYRNDVVAVCYSNFCRDVNTLDIHGLVGTLVFGVERHLHALVDICGAQAQVAVSKSIIVQLAVICDIKVIGEKLFSKVEHNLPDITAQSTEDLLYVTWYAKISRYIETGCPQPDRRAVPTVHFSHLNDRRNVFSTFLPRPCVTFGCSQRAFGISLCGYPIHISRKR